MTNEDQQQIEDWKIKSNKWDELAAKIEACYVKSNPDYKGGDDEEEYIELQDDESDLSTIGEIAATAFGWL